MTALIVRGRTGLPAAHDAAAAAAARRAGPPAQPRPAAGQAGRIGAHLRVAGVVRGVRAEALAGLQRAAAAGAAAGAARALALDAPLLRKQPHLRRPPYTCLACPSQATH